MAQDRFIAADGTGLEVHDSAWKSARAATYLVTNLEINNNTVEHEGAWDTSSARHTGSTEDCSQIVFVGGADDVDRYIAVRMSSNNLGYGVRFSSISAGDFTQVTLSKDLGGFLGSASGLTFPTADDHTVKITASGTDSVLVKVWVDGELVLTYTDSSSPLGVGNPGFFCGSDANVYNSRYKDWTDCYVPRLSSNLLLPDQGILTPKPSYGTSFARSRAESESPGLWDGLTAALVPGVTGVTGARLPDLSGRGNHGTLSGATWIASHLGPVMSFDGTDDYADIPHAVGLGPKGSWTVALLANFETTDNQYLVSKCGGGAYQNTDWLLRGLSGTGYRFSQQIGGTFYALDWTVAAGWHFFVGAYTPGRYEFWGDGILRDSDSTTGVTENNQQHIRLAERDDDDAGGFAAGEVAAFMYWPRRHLLPNEIRHLNRDPLAPFRKSPPPIPYPAAVTPTRRSRVFVPQSILSPKPSVGTSFARSRAESANEGLWDGLVFAAAPSVTGATGLALKDLSGWGEHGIISVTGPDLAWVASEMGTVIEFQDSASVDYINVASPVIRPFAGDGTFGMWIKPTASGASRPIIGQGSTAKVDWWYVMVNINNTVHFSFDDSDSARVEWDTTLTVPDGEWSFVSVVKSSSGFVSYINGVASGSGAARNDCSSAEDITLGYDQYAGSSRYWWGGMGSTFLHTRALAVEEIQTLYRDPLAPFRLNADYAESIPYPVTTPTLAPLRKADNSITPRQSARHPIRLSDNSVIPRQPVYHHISTPDTILSPKPSYASGYARGRSEAAFPGLWDSLVGAWSPELTGATGERLLDVANNNHGTLDNMEASDWAIVDGRRCLDFGGTDEKVSVGDVEAFDMVASDFTIAAWLNCTSSALLGILTKGTGSTNQWAFATTTSNLRAVGLRIGGTWAYSAANAYGDGTGGWYHVAVTYLKDGTAHFYRNGVLHDTSTATNTIAASTTDPVTIGCRQFASFLIGQLAGVSMWSRILSAAELQQLYSDPLAPFRLDHPVNLQRQPGPEQAFFDVVPWSKATASRLPRGQRRLEVVT